MKTKFWLIPISLMGLFAWQCAAIGSPGGGLKDNTPPELLSADPPSGTVNLSSIKVQLKFSEYMDEKSFENGIRFAPVFREQPNIHIKGDEVIITLPDEITRDMTVVITLSRMIKDEHGVELAYPIQLAYSTGNKIHHGTIRGNVYSGQPTSVYLFQENDSDTLMLSPPDYISETGDDGSFEFNFLPDSTYEVLSIDRAASGARLDPSRMAYGVYWERNIFLDSLKTDIRLRLHREESPLRLLRGEWLGWNHGQIYFNNQLPREIVFNNLKIGTKKLNWFINPADRTSVMVATNDSLRNKKEQISFSSIMLDEKILLDSSSIMVGIPSERDTSYLRIIQPESKVTVIPDRTGPPLELIFSRPIGETLVNHYIFLLFTDDTTNVEINQEMTTPMSLSFFPLKGWQGESSYQLKIIRLDTIELKNALKDSVTLIDITTNRQLGYGGLLGSISGISGNLVAEINHTENMAWKFMSIVNSSGQFEFIEIPEGKYTFSLFEDIDNNFVYSYGKVYPFKPSEWFYESGDTIEVRANWDIELSPLYLEQ